MRGATRITSPDHLNHVGYNFYTFFSHAKDLDLCVSREISTSILSVLENLVRERATVVTVVLPVSTGNLAKSECNVQDKRTAGQAAM